LTTRIADDPIAAALMLADEIARQSPDAIRAAKRLYNETWTGNNGAAPLVLETDLQVGILGKPNQIAAVTAGMQGEQAIFSNPE
jgi:enoyl-CoA hydratase/carnithine racemase